MFHNKLVQSYFVRIIYGRKMITGRVDFMGSLVHRSTELYLLYVITKIRKNTPLSKLFFAVSLRNRGTIYTLICIFMT